MRTGLIKDRPEQVVGDRFRDAGVEPVDGHPLFSVAGRLFLEDGIDGLRVLVAVDVVLRQTYVLTDPGYEIEVAFVLRGKPEFERAGRGRRRLGRPVRPQEEILLSAFSALALDVTVGLKVVARGNVPGRAKNEEDLDVFGASDPADDGLFVLAGPFQG